MNSEISVSRTVDYCFVYYSYITESIEFFENAIVNFALTLTVESLNTASLIYLCP